MAESSSAYASTSYAANSDYDVFINHRGPDVKKSFASLLYRRLLSHGLRIFLDQHELQRGDYLTHQIEDAILSASVHVAIFSPGYADSVRCLEELVLMLESKAPIIPVFYGVKPTELRLTRGKKTGYAEALKEHAKRCDSNTIEKWRNALSYVADISGFVLEAFNGDEGYLLDEVVRSVLKKMEFRYRAAARYRVGLDEKILKIKFFRKIIKVQNLKWWGLLGSAE